MLPIRRAFIQEDLADPHNSSLFLRLAHSPNSSVLIRPPLGQSDDYLIAAKISSKEQFLAVTGALVGKEVIQSLWNNAIESFNISDSKHLYWLDEGGYVIATNQINVSPGTFIGSKNADPQVKKTIDLKKKNLIKIFHLQIMQGLLMGSTPLYERKTIVKVVASCPLFVKSAPISSAPIFGARWISNLTGTLFGVVNVIYSFIASLLWTGLASGKLHPQSSLLVNADFRIGSNIPSGNGVGQT